MTLKGMLDRKLIMLVLTPVLRRLGTVAGTWLVATGAPSDTVEAFGLWAAAGIGVTVDLVLAYAVREKRDQRIAEAVHAKFDATRFGIDDGSVIRGAEIR